jgi:hypothetical protein
MLDYSPNVKRFALLTLLGAGLGIGSGGIVMSAKTLIVKAQSTCEGISCTSAADCGDLCFCNDPQQGLGICRDPNLPC